MTAYATGPVEAAVVGNSGDEHNFDEQEVHKTGSVGHSLLVVAVRTLRTHPGAGSGYCRPQHRAGKVFDDHYLRQNTTCKLSRSPAFPRF